MENQNSKELEMARLFEVEELEERMEFGRWSAEVGTSTEVPTGATSINAGVGLKF